ncbi:hypothetical protein D3C76_1182410 [compost metagenome]
MPSLKKMSLPWVNACALSAWDSSTAGASVWMRTPSSFAPNCASIFSRSGPGRGLPPPREARICRAISAEGEVPAWLERACSSSSSSLVWACSSSG